MQSLFYLSILLKIKISNWGTKPNYAQNIFKYIYILTLIVLFFPLTISAQTIEGEAPFNPSSNIVPPQPNTAALGKFGDTPISFYTGSPNISVPLYTLSSTRLSVPISINYHPSGLKVEERSSYVGTGWALNAGGVISRTVRGLPDESPHGYVNGSIISNSITPSILETFPETGFSDLVQNCPDGTPNINHSPHHQDLENAASGIHDYEPDLFTFNFAGYSGKFTFDQGGNPYLTSHQDVIIETNLFDLGNGDGTLGNIYFKITTPDGNQYFFGGVDLEGFKAFEVTVTEGHANCTPLENLITVQQTGWYLRKIIDVNEVDEINFIYENYSLDDYESQISITKYQRLTSFGPPLQDKDCKTIIRSPLSTRVKKIIGAHSYVEFFVDSSQPRCDVGGDFPLKEMKIFTNNIYQQKWEFTHSSFANVEPNISCGRLRLDAVQQIGNDNTTIPPYVFTYDSQPLPDRLSTGQDHWGYYNGQDENPHLVPESYPTIDIDAPELLFESCGLGSVIENLYLLPYFEPMSGADREPEAEKMKAGSIESITYPTGGASVFEFEPHDYKSDEVEYEINQRVETVNTQLASNEGGLHTTTFTYDPSLLAPYTMPKIDGIIESDCEIGFECLGYVKLTNLTTGAIIFNHSNSGYFSFIIPLATEEDGITEYELTAWHINPTENVSIGNLRWEEANMASPICNKVIGGLRIKSITEVPVVGEDITTYFEYLGNPTSDCSRSSSGKLITKPEYSYLHRGSVVTILGNGGEEGTTTSIGDASPIYLARTHNTTIPLGMTHGSHIGYTKLDFSHPMQL